MKPVLHHGYTRDEAIAAFGEGTRFEAYCDDQFVVVSKAVLCLLTIGDLSTQPHLFSPSRVVWKPARLDYDVSDEYPWLPTKVREVCDRSQGEVKRVRDHHVFLRSPADELYFYTGRAHLGSYGGPLSGGTPADRTANFSLDEKLPRDEWLRFGGYPGWLVEINHQTHRVGDGDIETFQQLAHSLTLQEYSHLCMTRYEEDSLTVHTNGKRGWLMYLQDPVHNGIYTQDLELEENSEALEVFECVCGIDLEFPVKSTLPRDLAIRAATEFFAQRRLPRCVHWTIDWPNYENGDLPESTEKPEDAADNDVPF